MNDDSSPADEIRNFRGGVAAHLGPRVKVLRDDSALFELDKMFAKMMCEIAALKSRCELESGAVGLQLRENVPAEEATATRQIELMLGNLETIEQAIMAAPTQTIVGLGMKARHVAHVVSEYWDAPIEQIDWDGRAVRLLIEAVCQAAGVSLPFGGEAKK